MAADVVGLLTDGCVMVEGAPAGFTYVPRFLPLEQMASLTYRLKQLDWDGLGTGRRRSRVAKRYVLNFLVDYRRRPPRLSPGLPLPPFLDDLRGRVAERVGVEAAAFAQVSAQLCREYVRPAWHLEAAVFGSPVCRVSVGEPYRLQFLPYLESHTWTQKVAPGSLYVLAGPAREEWRHRIWPGHVYGWRYVITLRTLKSN